MRQGSKRLTAPTAVAMSPSLNGVSIVTAPRSVNASIWFTSITTGHSIDGRTDKGAIRNLDGGHVRLQGTAERIMSPCRHGSALSL